MSPFRSDAPSSTSLLWTQSCPYPPSHDRPPGPSATLAGFLLSPALLCSITSLPLPIPRLLCDLTQPHLQPWAPPAQLRRNVSPGTSGCLLRPWPFLTTMAPWLGLTPDCSPNLPLPGLPPAPGSLPGPAPSFTLPCSSRSCPLPSHGHPDLGVLTLPALSPLWDLTRTLVLPPSWSDPSLRP